VGTGCERFFSESIDAIEYMWFFDNMRTVYCVQKGGAVICEFPEESGILLRDHNMDIREKGIGGSLWCLL
jgi:hypothetical protein